MKKHIPDLTTLELSELEAHGTHLLVDMEGLVRVLNRMARRVCGFPNNAKCRCSTCRARALVRAERKRKEGKP